MVHQTSGLDPIHYCW